MNERRYLWKIIRDAGDDNGVNVFGYVRVEPPSVLAGQVLSVFIDAFATLELAKREYPEAQDCTGGQCPPAPRASVAHLPCESDLIAGGAYPDDWPN